MARKKANDASAKKKREKWDPSKNTYRRQGRVYIDFGGGQPARGHGLYRTDGLRLLNAANQQRNQQVLMDPATATGHQDTALFRALQVMRTQRFPVARNGTHNLATVLRRSDYHLAVLLHMVGALNATPCALCSRGGKFSGCISLPAYFGGTCSNCVWDAHRKNCVHHVAKGKGKAKAETTKKQEDHDDDETEEEYISEPDNEPEDKFGGGNGFGGGDDGFGGVGGGQAVAVL